MMQFVNLELGGRDRLFNSTNTVRVPFTFAQAAQGAYAMLQGFYFHRDEGDAAMRLIELRLDTRFDPLQSTTSGEVEISFAFPGDTSGFPGELSFDQVEAMIRVLVIGV